MNHRRRRQRRRAELRRQTATPDRERQLHHEQLLKHQSQPGRRQPRLASREMNLPQRLVDLRQSIDHHRHLDPRTPLPCPFLARRSPVPLGSPVPLSSSHARRRQHLRRPPPQLFRQHLRHLARQLARHLPCQTTQLRLLDPLGQRINRIDPRLPRRLLLPQQLHLRMRQLHPKPLQSRRPRHLHPHPETELLSPIRLVKEHDPYRTRLVLDDRREYRSARRPRRELRVGDRPHDRRRLTVPERTDRSVRRRPVIAPRKMKQHVPRRPQPQPMKPLRPLRTHPRQKLQVRRESHLGPNVTHAPQSHITSSPITRHAPKNTRRTRIPRTRSRTLKVMFPPPDRKIPRPSQPIHRPLTAF